MRYFSLLAMGLLTATPAGAEVRASGPAGFVLEGRVTVPATPALAYAALGRVGSWWNGAHTYSGNAANLTMTLSPGGCFCEAIPADRGGIEHGRVIYARPGQTLRVQAALGPLQSEAVIGTITWQLRAVAGGTEIVQTYVVGGYMRGGLEAVAPVVDRVMTEQLNRLAAHLRTGS